MITYLIQNTQTLQEFWSNNLGWVSVESADRFTGDLTDSPEEGYRATLKTEDGSELNLPLSGKWVPAFNNPYQCENCEYTNEYSALPQARDLAERFEPSETYTDVECPLCSALCFPVPDSEPEPEPGAKLTLGQFRRLTAGMADSAVVTYHGHDKGCCLIAHRVENVWMYPKGATPTHVVINPGANYDHRTPSPLAQPEAEAAEVHAEVLVSHRQLVRQLDVLLNGEEGAAKQASLCDIVCQVSHEMQIGKLRRVENPELMPATTVFSETEMIELLEFARLALQDGEFFDQMAEECDLADADMVALRDKLQAVMDSDAHIFETK
jgi:hypothetical protein